MVDAFPPRHWTIGRLEAAVAIFDRASSAVQGPLVVFFPPEVVSLVDPWMMLDIGNGRVRLFIPGQPPPMQEPADSLLVEIVLHDMWLPEARSLLLREAGYAGE